MPSVVRVASGWDAQSSAVMCWRSLVQALALGCGDVDPDESDVLGSGDGGDLVDGLWVAEGSVCAEVDEEEISVGVRGEKAADFGGAERGGASDSGRYVEGHASGFGERGKGTGGANCE